MFEVCALLEQLTKEEAMPDGDVGAARLVEEVLADEISGQRMLERGNPPDAPQELSLAERVETGYVNPGWMPEGWANRLRQLADRCETVRPELAEQYRAWATNIERRLMRN